MVPLFLYFPNLAFKISNFLGFPLQTRVSHFEMFVRLGRFPDLFLNLSSVVFGLLEYGFVLDKGALQFLQLSVTVPSLSKHGLNLLSQSFDSGWTAYASRLRFYRAYFSL